MRVLDLSKRGRHGGQSTLATARDIASCWGTIVLITSPSRTNLSGCGIMHTQVRNNREDDIRPERLNGLRNKLWQACDRRISALACRIESRIRIAKAENSGQVSGTSDASKTQSGLIRSWYSQRAHPQDDGQGRSGRSMWWVFARRLRQGRRSTTSRYCRRRRQRAD
jgi:hypothetical protein